MDELRGPGARITTSLVPVQIPAASSPDPIERAAVLGPVKAEPFGWPRRRGQPLTGPARDGCEIWRSGRKNARGAGRTKEWNLPTQYPKRSPIFAAPYTRRYIRYLSGPPFTAFSWQQYYKLL